jgi:hypothetical protein
MPGCGRRTFLDPDHYEASLRQAHIELVITSRDKFKAHITWAELRCLQLWRCDEDVPRIGYLSLAPQLAFIAFSTGSGPLPVWGGTELQAGDVMLHSRGERLHQWTAGPHIWSLIVLDPQQLEKYGQALFGNPLFLPPAGRVLRPAPAQCGAPAAPPCAGLSPRRDQA